MTERRVPFATCAQIGLIFPKDIFKYKCLTQCRIRAFFQNKTEQDKTKYFLDCPSLQVHFLCYFLPVSSPHNFLRCILIFDNLFLFEYRKLRESNRNFTSKKALRKKSRGSVAKGFILIITAGKTP